MLDGCGAFGVGYASILTTCSSPVTLAAEVQIAIQKEIAKMECASVKAVLG